MKRPMLWLTASLILGIVAGQYLPFGGIVLLFLLFFLCCFWHFRKKSMLLFCLPVIFLMGSFLFLQTQPRLNRELQVMAENRAEVYVTGVVKETKQSSSGRTSLALQVEEVCGDNLKIETEAKISALLPKNALEPLIGDEVRLRGALYAFSFDNNPGDFNFARYYTAKGYAFGLYVDEVLSVSATEAVPKTKVLKQTLADIYDKTLPETAAGTLKALMLGEKQEIDSEVREQYRKAGISHILSISGLHITLISGIFLYFLERICRLNPRKSAAITILLLWAYCYVTGLGVATIRAVILSTVLLAGRFLYRYGDTLNSLALAAFLLLCWQPLYLWDVGFQLSFLAVLGILLGNRYLHTCWKQPPGWALYLCATVSATLFTMPITAYYFYNISPYGVLANLLVVPTVSLVLLSGIFTGIFGMISIPVATFFAGPAYVLLFWYQKVVNILNGFPGASLHIGRPSLVSVFLLYGLLFFLVLAKKGKKKQGMLCLLSAITAFSFAGNRLLWKDTTVAFLDVGQGDAAVISTYDRRTIVIDGGGSYKAEFGNSTGKQVLSPYLDYLGADQVDLLFLSHMDTDHAKGAIELMELVPVKAVVIGSCQDRSNALYAKFAEVIAKEQISLYTIQEGTVLELTKGVTLGCLYDGSLGSGNDESLVLKLSTKDHSILFTGDLEAKGEETLLALGADIGCDVLKVAHHGSSGSSIKAFLEATGAEYGVVSVGENNVYGHPGEETIERLEQAGIEPFLTSNQGAIIVRINEHRLRIEEKQ